MDWDKNLTAPPPYWPRYNILINIMSNIMINDQKIHGSNCCIIPNSTFTRTSPSNEPIVCMWTKRVLCKKKSIFTLACYNDDIMFEFELLDIIRVYKSKRN